GACAMGGVGWTAGGRNTSPAGCIGLPLAMLRSCRRHGASAVAEVCRPKELTGLGIIANCVHETKMHGRSKLYLFDTEALRKRLHHFGQKGIMNAECVLSQKHPWRKDCTLQRHLTVDYIDHHLKDRRRNPLAAGPSDHQKRLTFPQDNGWRQFRHVALAGRPVPFHSAAVGIEEPQ